MSNLPRSTRIAILECRNIGELLIRISENNQTASLCVHKSIRDSDGGPAHNADLWNAKASLDKIANDLVLIADHMKELVENLVPSNDN